VIPREEMTMPDSMSEILNPNLKVQRDSAFPHAPEGWTRERASELASEESIELTDDHWAMIGALHEYFAKHGTPRARELHDALDEKFHVKGGLKHLYELFPGGPVAQGCRLAGLEPPAGSTDKSFGSVQ